MNSTEERDPTDAPLAKWAELPFGLVWSEPGASVWTCMRATFALLLVRWAVRILRGTR